MNKFIATGWIKHSEEDMFNGGCIGRITMDGGHDTFNAATVEELIKQCAIFCGQDDLKNCLIDSCEEAGRLDIQVYEKESGDRAYTYDMERWKKGELRLWLATYTFQLLKAEKFIITRTVADKSLYAAV